MSSNFSDFGFKAPDILLPSDRIDAKKWAVVACDQYTSQPEYWESLSEEIGDEPSTLRLIFPEVYLETGDKKAIISSINENMKKYLDNNVFQEYKDSFILVRRETESGERYGLMVALDLEAYDYSKESRTLIRATEGTILSRIPPRKEIRKDAPIELPHIMVLISDKRRGIIEPLAKKKDSLRKVYDTDLNKNGGHLTGYLVDGEEDKNSILAGFSALYGDLDPKNPLLFAMGDGNHSLATAKSCWEDLKANLTEEERKNHPARYALVELENIFDEGLQFEPIHRVVFGVKPEKMIEELEKYYNISREAGSGQKIVYVYKGKEETIYITNPTSNLPVGSLQKFIDESIKNYGGKVDYIHGDDVTRALGSEEGNIGFLLERMEKTDLFKTVILDGALPRKTFSMGHSYDKRYYLEARKIR